MARRRARSGNSARSSGFAKWRPDLTPQTSGATASAGASEHGAGMRRMISPILINYRERRRSGGTIRKDGN